MGTDKTYSELWDLTNNKDCNVREIANMAIKTLDRLHKEISVLNQTIYELKKND